MAVRVDFLNPDVELHQSQQKRKDHGDIDQIGIVEVDVVAELAR